MGSLSSVTTFKPLDPNNFTDESHIVIDFISKYYKDVEKYPVQSQVKPGYLFNNQSLQTPPSRPQSLETILENVRTHIIPGLTHWQSPNYFAYFQANASTAGFLGEMLCSGFNVVGFNWISSPAATELEMLVMEWMAKMLKLPQQFLFSGNGGGVLHGSTCEAVICTLAAARDKALNSTDGHIMIHKFVVYCSDQTHFTLQKASKLVGIPPANFRSLKTSSSTSFTLSPEDVERAMQKDISEGLVPLFLCATIGTTPSCAVDPLEGLGYVAKKYGVWFHIDAAYAGSACICPEFRPYLNGVELADSISMNPHKWFLTNMDCCCLWVKDPKHLIDSLSTDSNEVVDYKDWQIAQSRRFRAIKLWLVIRRYGVDNLIKHIRDDVKLAMRFEGLIEHDDRFEVVVPRRLALICFRLTVMRHAEDQSNELNRKLLDAVNSSGHALMSHAILDGVFVLRCAIGTTMTEEQHVVGLWKLIQEKAGSLIEKNINFSRN